MTTDKKTLIAQSKELESMRDLDRDKLCLVADTFSSATMYLHSELEHGYIGLNGPDLYSFQLPHPDVQHNGVTEILDNFDVLYKWEKENVYEVNMIKPEDEDKLGVLQRDPVTGELFTFIPLEIDALLEPDQDIDFPNNCTLNVPNNVQINMPNNVTKHYPTDYPNDIKNTQNIKVQLQTEDPSINDRKDNIVIDLDINSLIGLNTESSTDPQESPENDVAIDLNIVPPSDTNIVLDTDLNSAPTHECNVEAKSNCSELTIHANADQSAAVDTNIEAVEEIGSGLVPSDSLMTLGVGDPEEKLSQITLMEAQPEPEPEREPIKEDDDEAVAESITNICDVVVPQMSLKFSLAFNFDEICMYPADYQGKQMSGSRKIFDFHKLPYHKREFGHVEKTDNLGRGMANNKNNNNNNNKDDDKMNRVTITKLI